MGPISFDVAPAFPLKAPTRLNTIELAIDVDHQQCRGMISRPTGRVRLNTIEAEVAPPRGGRPPRGSGRPAACAARGRTSDAEPRWLRSICLGPNITSAAAAPIGPAPGARLSAARRRWSGRESHATVVHDHRLYRAPEHAPSKAPRSLRR
jgi:hypothetical protein